MFHRHGGAQKLSPNQPYHLVPLEEYPPADKFRKSTLSARGDIPTEWWLLIIVVVLALLSIGAFLFSHFYPKSLASDLSNQAAADQARIQSLVVVANETINTIPVIYYGAGVPHVVSPVNGSLFIDSDTQVIYYYLGGVGWFIAYNGTQTEQAVPGPPGAPGPKGTTGNGTSVNTYNQSLTYAFGDIVRVNYTSVFISLVGNNTDIPGTNNQTWYLITPPIVGPPGSPGAIGPPGPPGDPNTGVQNVGAWNTTATYLYGDIVTYNGSTFLNRVPSNTGHQPDTSPSFWMVLVDFVAGPPGPPGAIGNMSSTPGAPGPPGPDQIPQTSWNPTSVYNQTTILIVNGTVYVSLIPHNQGIYPGTNSSAWMQLNITLLYQNGTIGPAGPTPPSGFYYAQQYNTTVNYTQGALVLYQNTWFVLNVTSSVGDLPSLSPSIWALVDLAQSGYLQGSDGPNGSPVQIFTTWNASIDYPPYTVVIYNNQLYLSNGTNNLGNDPNATTVAQGHWFVLIGNVSFTSTTPGPAGPIGPPGVSGQTITTTIFPFAGAFNSSVSYPNSTIVDYNNQLYIAYTPQPAGVLPTDPTSTYSPAVVFYAVNGTGPTGLPGPPGSPGANNTYTRFVDYFTMSCPDALYSIPFYQAPNGSTTLPPYQCTARQYYGTPHFSTLAISTNGMDFLVRLFTSNALQFNTTFYQIEVSLTITIITPPIVSYPIIVETCTLFGYNSSNFGSTTTPCSTQYPYARYIANVSPSNLVQTYPISYSFGSSSLWVPPPGDQPYMWVFNRMSILNTNPGPVNATISDYVITIQKTLP